MESRAPDRLSIKACRDLVDGRGRDLSDTAIASLRDQLYAIAGIAVTEYTVNKARFPSAVGALTESDRLDAEERAGIMEFDGGLSRDLAERLAISQYACLKEKRKF